MLRAKFKINTITRTAGYDGETVVANPVYSADPASENHQFWKASPSGELKLHITNPEAVGKLVAERAVKAGVSEVVFDRGGFLYHGRVKALADAAREGGLEF